MKEVFVYVIRTREMRNAYRIIVGIPESKILLRDLEIDGKLILK
jgi:hypothetical protein